MAHTCKLSAIKVGQAKGPAVLHDGGGLYLRVSATGAKSWVFRFQIHGKRSDMGIGALHTFSLAEARERARDCRKLVADGVDPIERRKGKRATERLETARGITFRKCAEAYIAAHKAAWKNAKHAAQWPTTLGGYVYPIFGSLPVQVIDTALVMKAIEPLWTTRPETASRVRGRIESVLDWATARGYRAGENPARWRGHLENLLPKKSKVAPVEHHKALPYVEIGAFMAKLRKQEGVAARALEFAILTAARSGEVRGARWDEINLAERLWTVPAGRMKAGKEHRVPLSDAAMAILENTRGSGEFVFPGARPGRALGEVALLQQLRRMDDTLTAHGFRSTFRDFAAERTNFPNEIAEMALAHVIGNRVEAAYRRGDLIDKRRQLADAWARFCATAVSTSDVVPLRRAPVTR